MPNWCINNVTFKYDDMFAISEHMADNESEEEDEE